MRRTKKESELGCLRCMLCGLPCHTGTLPGSCIRCGSIGLTDKVTPFEGFFSHNLRICLLSLARLNEYAILSSDEDVLEIITTNPNGLPKTHRLYAQPGFLRTEFLPSNSHLSYQLDQIVWLYCTPNIRCRTSQTGLITSALFGRAYLSVLFPTKVVNEAGTFFDRFRLLNICLTRLDESISEVVNGFNKRKVPGDDRYWSEASASLAILCVGLQHAQVGLKDRSIKPICDDAKLADALTQRIQWTLEHLTVLVHHRGLSCDTGWASILDGSLEDLRSNVKLSSLSARIMKEANLMSTRSFSATSSGSTLPCATSSPLSSIDSRTPEDINNSACTGWLDDLPRPTSSPFMEVPISRVDQVQNLNLFNHIPPLPTNNEKQNCLSSPLRVISCGNTSTVCEHPPVPASYMSWGNGFSNLMSPEPLPKLRVLGMCCDILSEIEQDASHVSGPLSYCYDTREETSVMASRNLFPDSQFYLRPSAESNLAESV